MKEKVDHLDIIKEKATKPEICQAIRIIWESIDSHLGWIEEPEKDKKIMEAAGDVKFHSQCIKRYSKVIRTLAKLL